MAQARRCLHGADPNPEPHDVACAPQAFDGGRAGQELWRARAAACVALLGALAALAEKGGLGLKGDLGFKAGAVADAVAGRAAREVGALGVLLLARAPDGRPKTPEQVRDNGNTLHLLLLLLLGAATCRWACAQLRAGSLSQRTRL